MSSFTINGYAFDPASSTSSDTTDTNYIIVKGKIALKQGQKKILADHGVEIQDYCGNDAYLCRFQPNHLEEVRSLPFIESAVIYPSNLKRTTNLKDLEQASASDEAISVDILLHKDSVKPLELATELNDLPSVRGDTLEIDHRRLRVTVEASALEQIQQLDSVLSIERAIPKRPYNDKARTEIEANLIVNEYLCDGSNQVVAVADTGFDTGSLTDVHPAFGDRVLALLPVSGSCTNDPEGHGTHVAGSVLGDGVAPMMGGAIQGTAPKASLVVQSLLDDNGKFQTPANLYELFSSAYGPYLARVHSNSWGPVWGEDGYQVEYDNDASAVDSFVWHNQDCVICFAAGNDGEAKNAGVSQIGSAGAAKNCITIGACYSPRPTNDEYAYDPARKAAHNSSEIAGFSSRGPTVEGRIKPDLVAPGTAILSALSRDTDVTEETKSKFGKSADPFWTFNSGTSMATPLVAGCVASLRQALISIGVERPSAALVKALLINGATDLQGQYGARPPTLAAPTYTQGFGRVALNNSFIIPGSIPEEGFFDNVVGLQEDENWQYSIPGNRPAGLSLKVTLAYSDRAGSALQNKLVLSVIDSNENKKRGDDGVMAENNVQQVVWKDAPSETIIIMVEASRIARIDDTQSFAVVWRMF